MKRLSFMAGLLLAGAVMSAGDDLMSRHQAFRSTIAKNPTAAQKYLNDQDAEIRRYAVYTIALKKLGNYKEVLVNATKDKDSQVRLTAVSALNALASNDANIIKLMDSIARTDTDNQVRQIALKASWPFHRQTTLLRDDKDWDHDVVVAKKFEIPTDNWKIKTDPDISGHVKGWFAKDFKDDDWQKIKVGHWENQCLPDYDGFAWYRIKFKMPPKMDFTSIELAFGAVDEGAWVWLNGVYLGSHNIGVAGWDVPFNLDCRKEAIWGEENVLVVRVQDTSAAGGIWKPISVEILK